MLSVVFLSLLISQAQTVCQISPAQPLSPNEFQFHTIDLEATQFQICPNQACDLDQIRDAVFAARALADRLETASGPDGCVLPAGTRVRLQVGMVTEIEGEGVLVCEWDRCLSGDVRLWPSGRLRSGTLVAPLEAHGFTAAAEQPITFSERGVPSSFVVAASPPLGAFSLLNEPFPIPMGSRVTFDTEAGFLRFLTLADPHSAEDTAGQVVTFHPEGQVFTLTREEPLDDGFVKAAGKVALHPSGRIVGTSRLIRQPFDDLWLEGPTLFDPHFRPWRSQLAESTELNGVLLPEGALVELDVDHQGQLRVTHASIHDHEGQFSTGMCYNVGQAFSPVTPSIWPHDFRVLLSAAERHVRWWSEYDLECHAGVYERF